MKLNMFLLISAIIAMVFGLGFVLLPGFLFSIYGLPGNPPTLLGFRFFGSALISLALITWLLKDSADWNAIRAVLIGNGIGNIPGVLAAFFATINGTLNAMGWSAVLIYLLLGLGDAYFLSRGPAAALERGRY
jgi:hypothetical protein